VGLAEWGRPGRFPGGEHGIVRGDPGEVRASGFRARCTSLYRRGTREDGATSGLPRAGTAFSAHATGGRTGGTHVPRTLHRVRGGDIAGVPRLNGCDLARGVVCEGRHKEVFPMAR